MAEKKTHSRSVIIYISAALLFIAGFFIWRNFKYKLVNKKLDNLVSGKSKGLYQLSYQHLVIDETLGNISAEEVELLPDSEVYRSMTVQNTAPQTVFYIRIPRLSITGVKTPKALLNKEISAHIIRIQDAKIEMRASGGKHEKHGDFKSILASEQYRQLIGKLKSIHADSVVLENASLLLRDNKSKDITCQITGLSIRFAGLAIDSVNQNDSSRLLFTNDQAIHFTQLILPQKNKQGEMRISGLDYNSKTGLLHTDKFQVIPYLSESAFAKANHFAKDRLNMTVGSMDFIRINRQALLHQKIVADSLLLGNASFHIFRDKSVPHDSLDRTNDFPQQVLMRLTLPVYIGSIIFKDSYIEYKEKNDQSDSSGKVAFHHVQCRLTNVTNMPDSIRKNNLMRMHFNASFLDKAAFTVEMRMRLNDRKGSFQLNAELGEISATELNTLLKPMALAELDKGDIHSLKYNMDATSTHTKGTLILKYSDIKIKLLKKDDDKNKYKTKFLPSLAAGVLLKKSNPQNGKTRVGEVDFTRDIHRSIFNFMWKSLFSGIKQVAL
jgi:hypothetical protein